MKKASLYLSVGFFYSLITQIPSCNKNPKEILWTEDKKIQWQDFKAPIRVNDHLAAEISVRLKLEYVFDERLNFDVSCFMIKNQSWVSDKSDYALSHEQGHFDIGEIVARSLRKEIQDREDKITVNNVHILDSLYYAFGEKLKFQQNEYDSCTTIPVRNREQQTLWNRKIKLQLDSLSYYKRNENEDRSWKKKISKNGW